jgi:hypothetical protein
MSGFVHALIVAVPALVGGASAVRAADTTCSSTLTGTIDGNVVVPDGASVLGTGQTSGNLYIVTGSTKFIGLQFPPGPVVPVVANFMLETTNGCASVPLPLSFGLSFASDGTLLPESSVSIASATCLPDQPGCTQHKEPSHCSRSSAFPLFGA